METYTCYYPACQKVYNSKYNLIRHINCFHLDAKSYYCPYCAKGFYNKQSLESHQISHGCEVPHKPQQDYNILLALQSTIEKTTPKVLEPSPLLLPVLPKIEYNRQVPLIFAKLPINQSLFDS